MAFTCNNALLDVSSTRPLNYSSKAVFGYKMHQYRLLSAGAPPPYAAWEIPRPPDSIVDLGGALSQYPFPLNAPDAFGVSMSGPVF